MLAPGEQPNSAQREARLAAACAADPALGEELEMICPLLDPETRERFLDALAEEIDRQERPAAAVLAALSHAVLPNG